MRNGQVSCNFQTNGGYICTARCNTNYVFYENIDQSSVEVTCSQGGDWSRVLPVCVAIHSASYELSFRLSYQGTGTILSSCNSAYKTQLDSRMASLISSLTNQCTSLNPPITVQQNDPIVIENYSSGVYATISLRLEPRDRSSNVYTTCATRIKNAFTAQSSVVDSIKQLSSSGSCPASYSATYQSNPTNGFGCSLNEEVSLLNQASTVCVECPHGYYSSDGRLCLKCTAGYYRDGSSQSCQQCPPNSRNLTQGAASIHDCYDDCPVGMISSTGKSPCSTCPINTYSRTDHRTCEPCPSGTQTPGVGAYSVNQCRGICRPGTYSITGFESCTSCPKGFYQPNSRSVTCLECALDQTTTSTGSTSQSQCQSTSTIECYSGRCRNGGTCYIEQHQYYCRCAAGFTGKECADRILACDSNPCYNNGICANNNNGGYTCYCSSGRFSGVQCEQDSNDCQFNQCMNNGSCHDKIGAYSCLCPSFSGFSGSSCQNIRDVCQEEPCTRGRCVVSGNIRRKCICDSGYTGDKCDQNINECLSSPCRNSGTCIDQVAGYTCQCASGYSGSNCEITSDKCSTFVCNSGTCVHNYQDGVTSCLCPTDYTNINNQCQPTNYCTSSTCKNNGICRSGGSGYICDCPVGYEGYQCQHNKDDCSGQPCKNNAICIDQVNNFTCQCDSSKPDTGGRFCDDLKDNCSPYPCNSSNTRSCRDLIGDYTCDCYSGYTGKNCQDYVNYCASYPCQHGGTCSNRAGGYTCQCSSGYSGNQCQQTTDYCSSSPCYNDGQCINTDVGYVCNCKSGYKGNRCQVLYDACAVANPCIGIGSRCSHDGTRFSCQCGGGYSGTYCEYKTNACTVSTCLNGGTCLEVIGQPVCQCPTGFTDSACSTNINDCRNTSCSAGSVCVDGVNSFTCKCETGKFGQDCQKDVTYDFDLLVSPNGGYLSSDYFIQPQKLSSTNRLSLSFWVRYTELSSPGTIATLYGTNFADNIDQSKELLRLNNDNLVASFGNQQTMTYNEGKLVDGKWHHVMLTWDGSVPLLMLYIDSMSVNSANYGYNTQLPPYMWLVLGGTWNSATKSIDQSSSMTGRISRMFVTASTFSTAERISLDSTLTYVPSNAIQEFTSGILDGVNALVDYNSELNVGGCYVNDTCTPLTAASTSTPNAIICPTDLMIVSQRNDLPSWPKPIYNNTENIRTNRLPGANPMDWGTYSIAFAGLDNQSNADVCSFNLYNRRADCAVPKKPLLGTINCVSVTDGIRCQVTCDQSNYRLAEPVPVYYSCGTYNSYGNNVLTYRYPSCTTCATPKNDITISVTFDLQLTCDSIGQSSIESNVRGSLIGLNSRYNGSICYSSDCSAISIISTCLFSSTTYITLQFKQIQSTITVGVQELPTVDVLSTAIIDDAAITITYGSMVRSTYDITSTSVCDVGRQLLDGCCVECGFGTYYDMSKLECMKCPQGTYLDAIGSRSSGSGSTPCIGCPGGMTTPLVGAQTVDECKDSCIPGRFYNLTIGRCEDCPEGFYQELAGTFYCQPCPVTMTTASSKSTSSSDCILGSYITSTVPPEVINTNAPSVGASTSSVWSPAIIALLVLVIIVVIVLFIVIVCCCCRGCLQSICPCFVSKVGPDEKTEWHHVNRYGETNIKFVSYKLSDVRKKKLEKQALVKSDSEEEVPPRSISIQVPVFEEKLNGMPGVINGVKKKSIHISSMAPRATTHRSPKLKTLTTQAASIPSFTVASGQHPKPLPPLPDRLRKTPTSTPEKVRRPPSAFNKPRVHPTSNDYEEFLVNKQRVIQDSKISIDSDDDDYR
ncbi:uncharacterized protein LOC126829791 [Patella vulgata]|uniref:uncharacterized protein LOC126829791 n=1 Tax=Patella vulgata TaxID=6465 RepID=UPI0024A9D7EB|nr:uncharacterized protein LOC126829791 [Patella vulgata]